MSDPSWKLPTREGGSSPDRQRFDARGSQGSDLSPTQAGKATGAFTESEFEAFGLQLKEANETISPTEQERLGVLQARMNEFWADSLERASRLGHSFSEISVLPAVEDPRMVIGGATQRSPSLAAIQLNSDSEEEEEADPSAHAEFDRAAHNEFLKNPIYRKWVDQILEDGSVNVSTSTNDPYAPRACWSTHHRQILIQEKFGPSPRRASMMAFEVTNAYQDRKARALDSAARAGDFEGKSTSGDTLYAHLAERIEYDGLTLHHTMMQWGIVNLDWPAELDTYGKKLAGPWSTFEGYLTTQEKSGHTNTHRSNYNQSLNPNRV